MGREERKLKKHLEQREQNERRKLAKKKNKSELPAPPEVALSEGQVVQTNPCTVRFEHGERICNHNLDIAAGDRVLFAPSRQRIVKVLPRSSVLSRPDPHNPRIQLLLAANVDLVVNVVSVKSPPLKPALVDRYLIAIELSGASPLICVNKVDLGSADEELRPYRAMGVPVVCCSAATGEGLEALRAAIAGKLCVFTGHSGVGKSSLLNALDWGLGALTAAVSQGNHKGRHTTTSSKIYDLPDGARVIDTPGIREFGLWDVSSADLQRYFHEFDEAAGGCAFSDCSHSHEPRCAVKDGVETGLIARARYEAYLRIRGSMAPSSGGGAEP